MGQKLNKLKKVNATSKVTSDNLKAYFAKMHEMQKTNNKLLKKLGKKNLVSLAKRTK